MIFLSKIEQLFGLIKFGSKELYIGKTTNPEIEPRTLTLYGDFVPIGKWGVQTQNEKGEWDAKVMGIMASETGKFIGRDGRIGLGTHWVALGMDEVDFEKIT